MAHWAESLNASINSFLRKTPITRSISCLTPPQNQNVTYPQNQKKNHFKRKRSSSQPIGCFRYFSEGKVLHHLSRCFFRCGWEIEISQSHSPNPIPSGCCVLWLSWFAHLGAVVWLELVKSTGVWGRHRIETNVETDQETSRYRRRHHHHHHHHFHNQSILKQLDLRLTSNPRHYLWPLLLVPRRPLQHAKLQPSVPQERRFGVRFIPPYRLCRIYCVVYLW